MLDFYCDSCQKDFEARYFTRENRYGTWFVSKCHCGNECIRYGDNKHLDPYFKKSKKMRVERDKYKNDLVQPGEEKFKTLYPEQWKKMQDAEERQREKERKEKELRDKLYKDNFNERSTIKKIFEREDAKRN